MYGMNRKSFVYNSMLGLGGSLIVGDSLGSNVPHENESLKVLESVSADSKKFDNEAYWNKVSKFFNRPKDFIQFEHGYFSHQPISTLKFHQLAENHINTQTSEFMRTVQETEIESARKHLSEFLGVDSETLVLTRNTTESLNIVIMGFPWKSGDEVIIGNQDYGSMVEAFEQASARFGIVIKVANVPLLPKNDEEIIDAYSQLVTSKTRMLHLTHTINLTGQVIPVNSIVERCKILNDHLAVAVDAAHSTAHTIEKIGSLNADFIGGSLHKWLCTPLGLGYLVMNKSYIDQIWPLFGDVGISKTNVRRFEHQGTRPIHSLQSIQPAIEFNNAIGFDAKLKRLQYLKESFLSKVDGQNGIQCISPWRDIDRGGAVFCIQKQGMKPAEFAKKIMKDFRIFTVGIDHPVVQGVRITPHLSNTIDDVNRFVDVMLKP